VGAIDAASHNTSGSPYDPIHPRVEAFSIVIAAHRATGQGERAREAARRMLEHGVDTVGPLSRWRALFTAIEVAADDRDRAWADALLDEAGALAPRLDEQRESTAHADALRNMGRRVAAWA
jgi:hypothetical protein